MFLAIIRRPYFLQVPVRWTFNMTCTVFSRKNLETLFPGSSQMNVQHDVYCVFGKKLTLSWLQSNRNVQHDLNAFFSKKLQTLSYDPIDGPSNVICPVFSARRWLASLVPVSCTVKHDLCYAFSKNTVFSARRWLVCLVPVSCTVKHDLHCVFSKLCFQ